MYIIACRAHFHHLFCLGQVGRFPRETSGSDGTLDRALVWPWWGRSLPKGNQWDCWDPGLEPQCGWALSPPAISNVPCTPQWPQCPHIPYTPYVPLMPPIPLLAPEYLHSLPAPNAPLTPSIPLTAPILADSPKCSPDTPTPPRSPPMPHNTTYNPAGPWAPALPASPQCTPDSPYTPWWTSWCPLHP